MRQGRQFALMRSPGYFNRSRSFFPQTFNAPRSHKFIDFLWTAGNLSIPLAAVDHFDSQFLGKAGKIPVFCKEGNFLFIFFIGLFLGVWRFFLVRMMANLENLVPNQAWLVGECAIQAVLFTLEWGLLFLCVKRYLRHDDEPRA